MLQLFKKLVVFLLSLETRAILRKYNPYVIAITGSVGKTSTKDAVYAVFKDSQFTRKSEKSFNSELGIPLSVVGVPNAWHSVWGWTKNILRGLELIIFPMPYPKVLVLEVGADHPGDIKRAANLLRPQMVLITRLPEYPVHVEYFSSPEEVRREKLDLLDALPADGILVGNGDDEYVFRATEKINVKKFFYGWGEHCDVRGKFAHIRYEEVDGVRYPRGMEFTLSGDGKDHVIFLEAVLGLHMCQAVLGALACGIARGESIERMIESLAHLETPRGRMRILQGAAKSVVIDDSYNSSPVAAEAALATLKEVEGIRKIAILGDMLELGKNSEVEHRRIGRLAASFVDVLLTVGKRAEWVAQEAQKSGLAKDRIHQFEDAEQAGNWMAKEAQRGDIILVKGSQGSGENMIRLERAVRRIMANPKDGAKLLVRQEKEWKQY